MSGVSVGFNDGGVLVGAIPELCGVGHNMIINPISTNIIISIKDKRFCLVVTISSVFAGFGWIEYHQ